ncbi:hypothetical protein Rsw2DRAFT_1745 [Rhodobacter ferrooxidans]|uniref:Uncharacterized protein n=1 Tax=Rhodobacter ferrooxidans TaxID=371731 RepID=C8S117_9RHOB|nr:hypothetical protein Rsw2DRAFT_1745 [Rhodobacter sp. SW2]
MEHQNEDRKEVPGRKGEFHASRFWMGRQDGGVGRMM